MYSIYDWPLDRSLGTDSSFLAPALSLDSALRDAWTLPCHSEMLLGRGRGREKMLDCPQLFSRSRDAEFSLET